MQPVQMHGWLDWNCQATHMLTLSGQLMAEGPLIWQQLAPAVQSVSSTCHATSVAATVLLHPSSGQVVVNLHTPLTAR